MLRICILIFLVSIQFKSNADSREYIRHYTYHASETDSKISARQSAIQQLQAMVIQEHGVSINASIDNKELLINGEYQKTFEANYTSNSSALTKTEIIDESWNGEEFYIKAKIIIDKDAIKKEQQLSDICNVKSEYINSLIIDIDNKKTQEKIVEIAMNHDFEGHCNKWQFIIADKFREKEIENEKYQLFLFNSLKTTTDYIKGRLLISAIKYRASIKPLSKDEFNHVIESVQNLTHEDIKWVINTLIDITIKPLAHDTPDHIKSRNEKKQWVSALDWQLSWLYSLAQDNKLGKPDSMMVSDVLATALELLVNRDEATFTSFYYNYHNHLDDNDNIRLSKKITRYIKRDINSNSLEILDIYIKDIPINKKSNTEILKLLANIESKAKTEPHLHITLDKIINSNSIKIGNMLHDSKIPNNQKSHWRSKYDLN